MLENNEMFASLMEEVNAVATEVAEQEKQDKYLLASALKEAEQWHAEIEKFECKAKKPSNWWVDKINSMFTELASMRLSTSGTAVGAEEKLSKKIHNFLSKANLDKKRAKGLIKWYNSIEARMMFNEAREQQKLDELIMAGIPDGVDEIDWYEIDRAESTADRAVRTSDPEWSSKVRDHIINTMDPQATGVATQPMKFKGKYIKGKNVYPILHRNVMQSLFWLAGNRSKGKLGFISDSRFTKEDREILINFVRASWDSFKK